MEAKKFVTRILIGIVSDDDVKLSPRGNSTNQKRIMEPGVQSRYT